MLATTRIATRNPGPGRVRGLTLIELMLALTVGAIIVTVATPSLHRMLQRSRITAAANEIVAGINVARQRAVMDNAITVMCPSSNGRTCNARNRWDAGWIVFRDPDRNRVPNGPDDVLRVGPPLEGVHADSAGRTRIRYFSSGFATGTNLTIKLCDPTDPNNHRAVIVNNPGRPRVADLPGHLSCPGAGE